MITIQFLGGSKKSFTADHIVINRSDISVNELLEILLSQKPKNTMNLDVNNILIAINGVDSSALEGKATLLKNDDVVSIIPVIHGGSSKRDIFTIFQKTIQIMEITGKKNIDVAFLEMLRKDFPTLDIQAVSSNFILNVSHVKKIISLSLLSQKNNVLLSNKLDVDILMRFALTSQISAAIHRAGMKPSTNFILIAIGTRNLLDSLFSKLYPYSCAPFSKDSTSFLQKQFGISKKQLNNVLSNSPLEDLLTEKAAVLI